MLDIDAFVARAEEHTSETVTASAEARRKTAESFIGKAGLLCVVDGGLAFVEDAILEPGQVTVTSRDDVVDAKLDSSVLDTTLVVHTTEGIVEFESMSAESATRIVEAAELPTTDDVQAPGAAGKAIPEPSAASETLAQDDEATSPPSQEPWSEDGLARGIAAARDGDAELDLGGLRDALDEDEDDEEEDEEDEEEDDSPRARARQRRKGLSRPREMRDAEPTSPRRVKPPKADVGRFAWVAYAIGLGCAGLALIYHWSVAVLAFFVGYVGGGYVAEQLNARSKQG